MNNNQKKDGPVEKDEDEDSFIHHPSFRGQSTSVGKTAVVAVGQISDGVQDPGELLPDAVREEACRDTLHLLKHLLTLPLAARTCLSRRSPVSNNNNKMVKEAITQISVYNNQDVEN